MVAFFARTPATQRTLMTITPLMPVYPRSPVRPVRGEGVYLYGEGGEKYLDFASGIAVNLLGHGHPHLTKRSEEHTSELQSLMRSSYAVFFLKQKQKCKHQSTA